MTNRENRVGEYIFIVMVATRGASVILGKYFYTVLINNRHQVTTFHTATLTTEKYLIVSFLFLSVSLARPFRTVYLNNIYEQSVTKLAAVHCRLCKSVSTETETKTAVYRNV